MKISSLSLAAAVAAVLGGMSVTPAQAQNPDYIHGDLVLFFQNPGGAFGADQTLFVSLGNTALDFRDRGDGTFTLLNIESALINAFGANWATETTLYAGLAGVWGVSGTSPGLQNGDPHRTIYTSRARNVAGLGTPGVAGSAGWSVSTAGGMTGAAGNIQGALAAFDTLGTSAIAQLSTSETTLDDNAPAGGTNFQAFTNPGIQQQGTAGSLGSFGGVDNIEFAVDLYRILARNNISGQVGGTSLEGSYEGSVVLNTEGDVSFIGASAIPEPSSAMLIGGGLGLLGFIRRRRA